MVIAGLYLERGRESHCEPAHRASVIWRSPVLRPERTPRKHPPLAGGSLAVSAGGVADSPVLTGFLTCPCHLACYNRAADI